MKTSSIGWKALALLAALAVVAAGVIWAGPDAEGGGRAFLGVYIEEEASHPDGGARVTHVVHDSAAAEAGIREGDIIQSVDGEPVRGPRGLGARLRDHEAGESVTVTVNRDGQDVRLDVELGAQSEVWAQGFDPETWEEFGERWADYGDQWAEHGDRWAEWGERFGARMEELGERLEQRFADGDWQHYSHEFGRHSKPRLGVQLVEPTAELREHLGADGSRGVLVAKVIEDTPAADAGIEVGDLIVAVDGEEIASSGDLVRALRERAGEQFDIDVIRDGRSLLLGVALAEDEDGPNAFMFVPHVMPVPRVPVAPMPPMVPTAPREPMSPAPPLAPEAPPAAVSLLDTV